jgi:hypothetical protein
MPSRPPLSYRKLVSELRSLQNQLKARIRTGNLRAQRQMRPQLKRLNTYEKQVLAACRARRYDDFVSAAFSVPFSNGNVPARKRGSRSRA